MLNSSIFSFITGWATWFFIDKHPSSLGIFIPDKFDTAIDNFQLAFDLLKDGYAAASFVYIWNAHYIILSILSGLLISIAMQAVSKNMRRRHLRYIMWPRKNSDKKHKSNNDINSD